jgi:hypothetical protein
VLSRFALMATTRITPMLARPSDIGDRTTLWAASSLERVPGSMVGATRMDITSVRVMRIGQVGLIGQHRFITAVMGTTPHRFITAVQRMDS